MLSRADVSPLREDRGRRPKLREAGREAPFLRGVLLDERDELPDVGHEAPVRLPHGSELPRLVLGDALAAFDRCARTRDAVVLEVELALPLLERPALLLAPPRVAGEDHAALGAVGAVGGLVLHAARIVLRLPLPERGAHLRELLHVPGEHRLLVGEAGLVPPEPAVLLVERHDLVGERLLLLAGLREWNGEDEHGNGDHEPHGVFLPIFGLHKMRIPFNEPRKLYHNIAKKSIVLDHLWLCSGPKPAPCKRRKGRSKVGHQKRYLPSPRERPLYFWVARKIAE